MTFKKGYFKEKDGFYFEVSYGLSRWCLNICKAGDEHDNNKFIIPEEHFKLKKEAREKFYYYLNNINLLKPKEEGFILKLDKEQILNLLNQGLIYEDKPHKFKLLSDEVTLVYD
jgi:hypothetical protein